MLRRLFTVAALAAFGWTEAVALPQNNAPNNDTGPRTHIVNVGRGDHDFSPDVVIADVGDTITFLFYPLNHSVVKMDPEFPCKPYEMIHSRGTGFWSGFQFLQAFRDPPPSYSITINDTQPLWFYCSAPDSCIKFQMVGVINPDNNTFPIAKVKSSASQADFSLSPGEPWPAEASARPNPDASSTPGSGSGAQKESGLSTGAIAGIAIGGVIALALVGLLFFFVGRNRNGADGKSGAQTDPAPQAGMYSGEGGLMQSHPPGSEHPPNYQDPRYSSVPPTPAWVADKSPTALDSATENPNRLSELPAAVTYDPVEIYTPMTNEPTTPRDQNQK